MNNTYTVTPVCKKSVYSKEQLYKRFNGITININIIKTWRYGEFTINLDNLDDINKIKKENPLIINNYFGELLFTNDCSNVEYVVENIELLPFEIKKEVLYEIYEDIDNNILFTEDILEEYGWNEGDIEYSIYNGFKLKEE